MLGEQFSRLLVIDRAGTSLQGKRTWVCQCACGNITIVPTGRLRSGSAKSCGCLRIECITKHGKYKSKVYKTWESMKQRCYSPSHISYPNYGGRGINVDEAWLSFDTFYKDMGDKPKGLTLERIDNNKGYSKENCKWATTKEQSINKRNSVYVN